MDRLLQAQLCVISDNVLFASGCMCMSLVSKKGKSMDFLFP